MTIKTLIHPMTGQQVKLGRRRPPSYLRRRSVAFERFVGEALPTPPTGGCNYASKAAMPALRNIFGNDTLGDCVIAMRAHAVGVFTANAGDPFVYSQDQVIGMYSQDCGYVPDQPETDQGCDELTVFQDWKVGKQHTIVGYVTLDPKNVVQFETAMWLFENLCFAVELPDEWITPFPSKDDFTWDVAGDPNPSNGHAFLGVAYSPTAKHVVIDTWGMLGCMTYAAMAKYACEAAGGGLYSVLSQDIIVRAKQKAPNGFNWVLLEAYLKEL